MNATTLGSIVSALALAACVSQIPEPTSADATRAQARWPGTTQAELAEGRSVFIQHCSSCHVLPRPSEQSAEKWPTVLDAMAPRASLTKKQRQLVERYLVVQAEAARP